MKKIVKNKYRAGLLLLLITAVILFFQFADAKIADAQTANQDFKVTTVYLVRHAERANEPAPDPVLNETGKTRAQTLARMLEKAGVKAIYTSQFQRAVQTAEPLAKLLGIPVTPQTMTSNPSNPREVTEGSIKQITDKIHQRSGEAVLVVGHTNTIPQVIKMLGGDEIPVIDEQKYDDLYIVTVYGKGKAKVVKLKY